MMKATRHALILELIERFDVETQDELASKLKEQGISVTQATVSRDIKELRLIKVLSSNGGYKYATADKVEAGLKERYIQIFSNSVVSLTHSGNLVIIKTITGSANAACEAIESMKLPEVAGTIAGDNTIFIAVKDIKSVPVLIRRLQTMMKPIN